MSQGAGISLLVKEKEPGPLQSIKSKSPLVLCWVSDGDGHFPTENTLSMNCEVSLGIVGSFQSTHGVSDHGRKTLTDASRDSWGAEQ